MVLEGRMGMAAGISAAVVGAVGLGAAWMLVGDPEEEDEELCEEEESKPVTPRETAEEPDNEALGRTMDALNRTMAALQQKGLLSTKQYEAFQTIPAPANMEEFNSYAEQLDPLLAQNPETGPAFQTLFAEERKQGEDAAAAVALQKAAFLSELELREGIADEFKAQLTHFEEWEAKLATVKAGGFNAVKDGAVTVWIELDEWVLEHLTDASTGWAALMQKSAEFTFALLRGRFETRFSEAGMQAQIEQTQQTTRMSLQAKVIGASNPEAAQQYVMICNALISGRIPAEQMGQVQQVMQQMLSMIPEAQHNAIEMEVEQKVPAAVKANKDQTIHAEFMRVMNEFAIKAVLSPAHMIQLLQHQRQSLLAAPGAAGPATALDNLQTELNAEYASSLQAKLEEYAESTGVSLPVAADPHLAKLERVAASASQLEKQIRTARLFAVQVQGGITQAQCELDACKPPADATPASLELYQELSERLRESSGGVCKEMVLVRAAWSEEGLAEEGEGKEEFVAVGEHVDQEAQEEQAEEQGEEQEQEEQEQDPVVDPLDAAFEDCYPNEEEEEAVEEAVEEAEESDDEKLGDDEVADKQEEDI